MATRSIEPGCLAYVTYSIRKPELAWTQCRVIDRCPPGEPTLEGERTLLGEWDCEHPDVPGIAVFHEKQLVRIDGGDPEAGEVECQDLEVDSHAHA
ncbi:MULTISPECIES: hypothetical protein [Halomonadaceae]|uniref:Uncharacterized protein n=1 Tax=Vreelandella titanicae TaxID=664683 RepID=A0AAP9NM39_9GAMM|nr:MULTISPECIES: hypothetical protein [Halomonas]QKS24211.1 hypothetical protein FX987_01985 [Halomonas titanicae]CDG54545.1 hypothetical protein HALA3H3_790024 [Halomonas sp. A3H3]SDI30847.1 hypothetical protein SAMN04487867_104205 [Halomonas titanicae]